MLEQVIMLMTPKAASGATAWGAATTWNPSDKDAAITLSNGNLTAAPGLWTTVRATTAKSSGKWVFEATTVSSLADTIVGVANSSALTSSYVGSSNNSWGYYSIGGTKVHTSEVAYAADWRTAGDVIGVVLDLDAGTLTFYKNGVSQGVAFTGVSGTLYPALTPHALSNVTANFGGSAFAYTYP